MNLIDTLPNEVVELIIEQCNFKSIINLMTVSQYFNTFINLNKHIYRLVSSSRYKLNINDYYTCAHMHLWSLNEHFKIPDKEFVIYCNNNYIVTINKNFIYMVHKFIYLTRVDIYHSPEINTFNTLKYLVSYVKFDFDKLYWLT